MPWRTKTTVQRCWAVLTQVRWAMQHVGRGSAAVTTAIAIATGVAVMGDTSAVLRRWEWRKVDWFFYWRDASWRGPQEACGPRNPCDPYVTVVTITDQDIETVARWPVPDQVLAMAIERIAAADPVAIGFDLYRDFPVEPGGERLAQLFRTQENLFAVQKLLDPPAKPPPALRGSDRATIADTLIDVDGVLRRALLTLSDRDGGIYFSLGTRLGLHFLQETRQIGLETLDPDRGTVRLGKAVFEPLRSGDGGYTDGQLSLGTKAQEPGATAASANRPLRGTSRITGSYQVLLNFVGPESAFHRVSLQDVLSGTVDASLFRDRIVLIGMAADSAKDQQLMPYSLPPLGVQEGYGYLSGVFLHANVTSALIRSAVDGRSVLVPWPQAIVPLWIALWASVGGLGVWMLQQCDAKRRLVVYLSVGLWFCLALLLVAGSYGAFLMGYLVPAVAPLVALSMAGALAANNYKRQQLLLTNGMLSAANQKLMDYASNLEERVRDRTAELEMAMVAADTANRAKSEFLANMSHELRTPLNGIIGYAQILQYDEVTEEQTAGLQTIYQCGVHLLTLINDILDLSKIEADKLELNPTPFQTQLFITGIVDIFKLKAEQKGIQFKTEIDDRIPEQIQADEKRLRQVAINLLGNAIKFTDYGSVTFRVRLCERLTGTTESDTVPLRFEVEDTGVGMTPEDAARVFLAFEQVGDESKKAEGTGLGLAISFRVVELMGSRLQVKSEFGMGTLFWFDATFTVPEDVRSTMPAQVRLPLGMVGSHRPKILVVDRDAGSRLLLLDLLEPLGIEMFEASTVPSALDTLALVKLDAVVTEMALPPVDGETAIVVLRKAVPDAKLIVLTANAFEGDRRRSLAIGCDAFLTKPLQLDAMVETLGQLLSIRWRFADGEDWASAAVPEPTLTQPMHLTGEMMVPDLEQLTHLQHLILKGDIFRLKEEVAELRSQDGRLDEFAREVSVLADGFELRSLRQYIDTSIEGIRDDGGTEPGATSFASVRSTP